VHLKFRNLAQFFATLLADGTMILEGETTRERLRLAETRDPGVIKSAEAQKAWD
jgi:hypothetical protein